MFRAVSKVASTSLRSVSRAQVSRVTPVQARFMSGGASPSDAEFDAKYIAYFDRKDIDGWEIRKVTFNMYYELDLNLVTNVSGNG